MKFALKIAMRYLVIWQCVCLTLPLCTWTPRVHAQKRAIVVSADQPNVWTLEQAHYLLAQMHRRNLDLKATGLGELDPNEINGLNFDVLRTLLEFGVAFNEADRFNNSLLKRNKSFDADRAIRLQKRRDQLADESLALNRDIARLGREQTLAKTQEEKDSLGAQITELTAVRDGNDKEVARLDNDLKTAGVPSGELQPTEAQANFDASKLPNSAFDDAFKNVTKNLIDRFNEAPKLNATLRLDNFLQMQYEILAKQLTLLRDEVGPGERIIFLEMPQTVNATYDKANKMWAQSWWKVDGYTKLTHPVRNTRQHSIDRLKATGPNAHAGVDQTIDEARDSLFTAEDLKDDKKLAAALKAHAGPVSNYIWNNLSAPTNGLLAAYIVGSPVNAALKKQLVNELNSILLDASLYSPARFAAPVVLSDETINLIKPGPRGEEVIVLNRRLLEDVFPGAIRRRPTQEETIPMSKIMQDAIDAYGTNGTDGVSDRVKFVRLVNASKLDNRSVRAIELIPRQSSLNINDIKLRARSGALTAIAKTLFGFGARLNFQRQRETFSQFVQQELYSSGFGKGATEFGWTFTPMPGTDRVLSGTRTTYAVMVVPAEAEALVMHTTGCYFPRSDYQPNNFDEAVSQDSKWTKNNETRQCSGQKSFAVPIPGGGDDQNYDFWVDGLQYESAEKGDRVVLSIYGRNFPAQIGLLVDGVPLTQSIGVAQPLIRDDSAAFAAAREELKNAKISGSIERIDAQELVAVFERPNGKDGTQPVLTLTAPGKAKILNSLKLYINGTHDITLNDSKTKLLFGRRPAEKDDFRIDKVQVFTSRISSQHLMAVVNGAGFLDAAGNSKLRWIMVNGNIPAQWWIDSASLLRLEFPNLPDEKIRITLVSQHSDPTKMETIESDPILNPFWLKITGVSVISYEAATDKEPGTLVVKIEGAGFSDNLRAYVNRKAVDMAVSSATEATLKITNPESAMVLILRDIRTGRETKTIITRKPEPPK